MHRKQEPQKMTSEDFAEMHGRPKSNTTPIVVDYDPRRTCMRCKNLSNRAAGRWVTKDVWWCNKCKKEVGV